MKIVDQPHTNPDHRERERSRLIHFKIIHGLLLQVGFVIDGFHSKSKLIRQFRIEIVTVNFWDILSYTFSIRVSNNDLNTELSARKK